MYLNHTVKIPSLVPGGLTVTLDVFKLAKD